MSPDAGGMSRGAGPLLLLLLVLLLLLLLLLLVAEVCMRRGNGEPGIVGYCVVL